MSKKFYLVEWSHKKLKGQMIVEKSFCDDKIRKLLEIDYQFNVQKIVYKNGKQLFDELSRKEISQEEKNTLLKFLKFENSEVLDFILGIKKHNEEEIKKAYEQINQLTDNALKLIKEAEKLADTYGLDFEFSVSYGMGGTYEGKGFQISDSYRVEGEWISSSSNC